MDITGFDITILVASTVGIILMSFTFPALGLTGDEATTEEIPEFEVEPDRFSFADDFPQRPNTPQSNYNTISTREEDEGRYDGATLDRIQGGTNAVDVYMVLTNNNMGEPSEGVIVEISNFSSDGFEGFVAEEINASNEYAVLERANYEIRFGLQQSTNLNGTESENEGTRATVSWEIIEEPDEVDPLLERLPIVGGFFESTDGLIGAVAWIANVLQWISMTMFDLVLNGLGMVVDVVTFMFGLAEFLIETYTEVISAEGLAPWASVILLIPGVMLMAVWAKLAVVAVEVIWIG